MVRSWGEDGTRALQELYSRRTRGDGDKSQEGSSQPNSPSLERFITQLKEEMLSMECFKRQQRSEAVPSVVLN